MFYAYCGVKWRYGDHRAALATSIPFFTNAPQR